MHYTKFLIAALGTAFTNASVIPRGQEVWQDYGELRIAVVSDYSFVYDDKGTGAYRDVTIWHPKGTNGFRPFGSIAEPFHTDRKTERRATVIAALNPAKLKADKPGLVNPIGWTFIYNDAGSKGYLDGSFWRPQCPTNYVSLGDVGSGSRDQPALTSVWCIRSDLTKYGVFQNKTLWDDSGSGAYRSAFLWEVVPENSDPKGSEKIALYTGTFRVQESGGPAVGPTQVLAIPVPKEYNNFNTGVLPKVTKNTLPEPGREYQETIQANVTLPLTAFYPPTSDKILNYMDNPFAQIIKSSVWTAEGVWINKQSSIFKRTVELEFGISKEQSTSMEHTAGVSVTASGGIKIVDYSVSLNYQFTSTSSSSTTEYQTSRQTEEFEIQPHKYLVVFYRKINIKIQVNRPFEGITVLSSIDSIVRDQKVLVDGAI